MSVGELSAYVVDGGSRTLHEATFIRTHLLPPTTLSLALPIRFYAVTGTLGTSIRSECRFIFPSSSDANSRKGSCKPRR